MFITFDKKTKKVIYAGEKKPIAYSSDLCMIEVDSIPTNFDWLTCENNCVISHNEDVCDIEKQKKLARIAELKEKLAAYDYIGVKIATGRATKDEYASQILEMIAWAAEINTLQDSLK